MKAEDSGNYDNYKPTKVVVASTKRASKKKPKDKPKRPLSGTLHVFFFKDNVLFCALFLFFLPQQHIAYNFFFKEEREKILKILLAKENGDTKVENDPESDDYVPEDQINRLRKEGGKVSFEEMGKIIGTRWKNIDPDRLNKYSELATEDTERYKKEMAEYNGRQEAKMRSESVRIANEALKPSSGLVNRSDGRTDPRSSQHLQQPYDTSLGYGVSGTQGVTSSAAYQAYMADYAGYSMYGYGGTYSMPGQGSHGSTMHQSSSSSSEMGRMSGQQMQDPQSYSMYGGYQGSGMGYGGGGQSQVNSQYDHAAMSPGDMQMYGGGSYGHSNQGWGHQ